MAVDAVHLDAPSLLFYNCPGKGLTGVMSTRSTQITARVVAAFFLLKPYRTFPIPCSIRNVQRRFPLFTKRLS